MSKQLLIEEAEFTTPIKIEKGLKESISIENNKDVLIIRNIPATIADRKNQNGRIYTTEVLQEAIKNANFQLKTKWMYSQADEHPEGSFVKPSHASHVVINAYIKKNVKVFVEGKTERHNVMFMDWEILNTEEGKNLKALILQETACPTSIRGLGDMEGEYVTNYELLGCDVVSNPSSGTSMRMPVSESIKVESSDKSYLDESFEVVTVSNDVVSDVNAAAQKQIDIENAKYGTITNIKTKLDQEIDPKTHAETTITSIEATTTDEVSELNQALQMAQNAFSNPVSKMDSVTISFVDDAEKAKESTVANAPNTKELEEKEDAAVNSNNSGENTEVKEFLDANVTTGDIDVLSASKLFGGKNESNENSIDQALINGLQTAIKELNDQILKEKDSEKIKKLKMNRDELEKLLNKNKASQEKDSEEKEKKEFLDFDTTKINGNNATIDSNNTEVNKDIMDNTEGVKETFGDNNDNIEVDKDNNIITLPLEKDSELQIKDNKISLQVDKNSPLSNYQSIDTTTKEDPSSNGFDQKTLENKSVSEDAIPNDQGGIDYTCNTATYNMGTGDFTCEDSQQEKLYNNPDKPSDDLVNQPLNDSGNDIINVVLTNLDYDISDPENITADDEQYLSELPHEVTISIPMSILPEEGEVDKIIVAQAAEQTGLPIKNAKIKSVSVNLLNNSQEESIITENENNTYTVYAFLNGQLKDEVEDITEKENAIQKAESFKQQYENQGVNFQVIVTKIDSEGFEDFDKLIYQYPNVEITDDLTDESIKEYTINDEPEEVFDFVNHKDIPDRTLLKDASGSIIQVFSDGDYNVDGNLDWTSDPGQLIDDLTNNGYKIVGAWINNKQIYSSEQQ